MTVTRDPYGRTLHHPLILPCPLCRRHIWTRQDGLLRQHHAKGQRCPAGGTRP